MHSVGQRIKAAQQLAGFKTVEALADEANLPKLSGKTLRRVIAGERRLEEHERERLAQVCDVPAAFFTQENFRYQTGRTPADLILDRLAILEDLAREHHHYVEQQVRDGAHLRIQTFERILQRLNEISEKIDDNARRLDGFANPPLEQIARKVLELEDFAARAALQGQAAPATAPGGHAAGQDH